MKIFLGGSKCVGVLPRAVIEKVELYIEGNCEFLVGDCHGADLAFQKLLKGYAKVTVFCSGGKPRFNIGNRQVKALGFEKSEDYNFYAQKDLAMAGLADCALMVWDGKSRGTMLNIARMRLAAKEVKVILTDEKLCAVIDKLTRTYVPFGALYVLPDGRILDLSVLPAGHDEFFEMTGFTAQTLSAIGWLRANTKVGYVQYPDCLVTAKQVIMLEEIKKMAGNDLQIRR